MQTCFVLVQNPQTCFALVQEPQTCFALVQGPQTCFAQSMEGHLDDGDTTHQIQYKSIRAKIKATY